MTGEMKHELRRLKSENLDGTPMYPGEYLLLWVMVGAVWHLVAMQKAPKLTGDSSGAELRERR